MICKKKTKNFPKGKMFFFTNFPIQIVWEINLLITFDPYVRFC